MAGNGVRNFLKEKENILGGGGGGSDKFIEMQHTEGQNPHNVDD